MVTLNYVEVTYALPLQPQWFYYGAEYEEGNWLGLEPMHVTANLIIFPEAASKENIFFFLFKLFS
jgi:hypothetical protein